MRFGLIAGGTFGDPSDDSTELARLADDLERSVAQVRGALDSAPVVIREDLTANLLLAERVVAAINDGGAEVPSGDGDEAAGERLFTYIDEHCHPMGRGVLDVMGEEYVPAGSETTVVVGTDLPDGTPVDIAVHGPAGATNLTATVVARVAAAPFTPTTVGLHEIVATSEDPSGRDVGLITVTDPDVSLKRPVAFTPEDEDGDGQFELLTVDVPVVVDRQLEVRLVAQFSSPEHSSLGGSSTVAEVPAGTTTVTLSYDTSVLHERAVAGPITIHTVLLIDEESNEVLAFADSLGTSPTYNASSW